MIDAHESVDLLQRFQQSDETAIKQLYLQYYRPLCYFADTLIHNQAEAEDIAVESFLKLLQKKQDFDNLADIKSFLFTVTKHACFDALRRSKSREKASRLMVAEMDAPDHFAEKEMLQAKVIQLIYTEMDTLPAQCKKVFTAVFIDKKSTSAIALEMGISTQTVLNQKTRAIQLLRVLLHKKGIYNAGVYLSIVLSRIND